MLTGSHSILMAVNPANAKVVALFVTVGKYRGQIIKLIGA